MEGIILDTLETGLVGERAFRIVHVMDMDGSIGYRVDTWPIRDQLQAQATSSRLYVTLSGARSSVQRLTVRDNMQDEKGS